MDLSKAPNPFGSPLRNLRPEMAAGQNQHRAYTFNEKTYEQVRHMLGSLSATHRLAFVTAALVTKSVFIDVRQRQDPTPFPEHGELFCAIIGDREIDVETIGRPHTAQATRVEDTTAVSDGKGGYLPIPVGTRIISRGPSWYHQTSLRRLFTQARHVMVDVTGIGLPIAYVSAVAPLVEQNKSAILVETSEQMKEEWLHFVNENTTNCQYRLLEDAREFSDKFAN